MAQMSRTNAHGDGEAGNVTRLRLIIRRTGGTAGMIYGQGKRLSVVLARSASFTRRKYWYILVGLCVVGCSAALARIASASIYFYAEDQIVPTWPGDVQSLPDHGGNDYNVASWSGVDEQSPCFNIFLGESSASACAAWASLVSQANFWPSPVVIARCMGTSGDSEAPYVNYCAASNDH